jgi:hypothetical protein
MKVNWDSTAADYASFRAGFPAEFYERLADHAPVGTPGAPSTWDRNWNARAGWQHADGE